MRFSAHGPLQPGGPGGRGRGVGGLALEPQLLVLGSDVIPEQLQGLLHGSLGVGAEVPRVLALQDLDDDFRDELQGGEEEGAGHQAGTRQEPGGNETESRLLLLPGPFIECLLFTRCLRVVSVEQPL